MTCQQLGFADETQADRWRATARIDVDELASRAVKFGVINYPLPESASP